MLWQIARWNKPAADGTASSVFTACDPALSPKIVTLLGSPPKAPMLSCTHCSASTKSRRYRLLSMVCLSSDNEERSTQPSPPSR
ncbi:Uncharacterised protein [Mycobacteroides abscessus subsp. abscessus]|nr:Uncharacterised protein [Mycobacteroides abscessus subsp. abscessus]